MNFLRRAYYGLLRHDLWNIGIIREPIHVFLEPDVRPSVHWLPMIGPKKFLADPFGIIRDHLLHILCEEYDYANSKGRIVSFDVDYHDEISVLKRHVVLEHSYHSSYPYLIEHSGEIFCIPETHQDRQISLYRATMFPTRWEKVDTLVGNSLALDPTVFQHEGLWWLTCSYEDDGPLEKLFVWYAKDLLGPWMSHAANPVKTDLRSARPAGTPFVHEGSLYRPAQNNSRTYGGAIVINKIVKLTPTEFEEIPVSHILPYRESSWSDGVHTISAVGDLTLIDAKRLVFVREAFEQVVKKNIGVLVHGYE